jgi:S1-C subfamily serine protease
VGRRSAWWPAGLVLALAGLFGAGCSTDVPTSPSASTQTPGAGVPVERVPEIVNEVEPSVVTIFVGDGLGSGVVYRANGVIVTNAHVVADADGARDGQVQVGFADGRRVDGRVRAVDGATDLALVEVERSGLPEAHFRAEPPQVGELAVAIGSPLGLANSATMGIISGLNRGIPQSSRQDGQPLVDLIQTDAAISPGNSGGALVDGQARIVGINEAYIPPQTGAVSLGFAIPAATVIDVADELLKTGSVRHSFVGVNAAELTPQVADRLGIDRSGGVVVLDVQAGSPADEAGIRPGDIVIAFDGKPVGSVSEFLGKLRGTSPGDRVTLGVFRVGKEVDVAVTVGERPR